MMLVNQHAMERTPQMNPTKLLVIRRHRRVRSNAKSYEGYRFKFIHEELLATKEQ